jgi:hypothetical protein
MFHLVGRAQPGRLLFDDWVEAKELWDRIVVSARGLVALVLMPNHIHLQHPEDVRLALGAAASGYARWRNARRGERGAVWEPLPSAEALEGEQKVRRSERYIHLNPCRARLVMDPLSWPFSTHRDAVDAAIEPVRRPAPDTWAYHSYVSSDPCVAVQGSLLPGGSRSASLEDILEAMSSLARVPVSTLRTHVELRRRTIAASRALTKAKVREISDVLQVSTRTVKRVDPTLPNLKAVRRVIGDPRFAALSEGFRPWASRRFVTDRGGMSLRTAPLGGAGVPRSGPQPSKEGVRPCLESRDAFPQEEGGPFPEACFHQG